ncbi:TfoX/Sxy family protein [Halomonas sp. MCCC 1A17488]|uniref:TfoX/Sxy family protein n=1 Tax=Billgrantia sulfidoxydans TaxID=2733484 RepID=A0ABX7W591_9GAMM|nr:MULTISPECIES: TfoX/Sxy family protein [Halomonas]MCE8015458.1 TfoX/Sxy family protein [Halomonas sp. MCCC 1A17488]MCG3238791.1 TfoX/Sxy family protein [Halomonas sp. MCCC 1A17488]QPP51244.1 TfoX/Sxy family protein [Halomonas sp. SS10-MC5]QTP54802.1 TfoX/Sxy family protein [Halomonas sulfidoxydans]
MSEYTDSLRDVFELFGPIAARRMFGGHGIYHDGLMFALVADETLYLKVDEYNLGDFERAGLEPFGYDKGGRFVRLSYYQAPEELFEDRELAAAWARRSFEAALRAQAGKRKTKP